MTLKRRPARKPTRARLPVEPPAPASPADTRLDRHLAHALDPAALFESAIGSPPDAWQVALLRSVARRTLVLCSRQSGKSTTSAVLGYHEALFRPPALVLLVAPSLRQSQELFRKVLDVHRAAGESAPAEAESALRLELRNGSRVIALPGLADTVRGFSNVRLLVLDEAARIDDALIAAVRPMLAVSRGRLLALTTPNGKAGWFPEAWDGGGGGWERIRVTAKDCPRISPEFLAEERIALGPALYAQEYECAFREAAGQLFAEETIASLFHSDVEPLFADDPEWVLPLGPVIEAKRLEAPAEASLVFDDDTPLPILSEEP